MPTNVLQTVFDRCKTQDPSTSPNRICNPKPRTPSSQENLKKWTSAASCTRATVPKVAEELQDVWVAQVRLKNGRAEIHVRGFSLWMGTLRPFKKKLSQQQKLFINKKPFMWNRSTNRSAGPREARTSQDRNPDQPLITEPIKDSYGLIEPYKP